MKEAKGPGRHGPRSRRVGLCRPVTASRTLGDVDDYERVERRGPGGVFVG
jgi:hypothetical protein